MLESNGLHEHPGGLPAALEGSDEEGGGCAHPGLAGGGLQGGPGEEGGGTGGAAVLQSCHLLLWET